MFVRAWYFSIKHRNIFESISLYCWLQVRGESNMKNVNQSHWILYK